MVFHLIRKGRSTILLALLSLSHHLLRHIVFSLMSFSIPTLKAIEPSTSSFIGISRFGPFEGNSFVEFYNCSGNLSPTHVRYRMKTIPQASAVQQTADLPFTPRLTSQRNFGSKGMRSQYPLCSTSPLTLSEPKHLMDPASLHSGQSHFYTR